MKKIGLLIIVLMGMLHLYGNNMKADTTYEPDVELSLIHAFYGDTSRKSFNCIYYMQNIDTLTVYDTIQGSYKMHNNKFWIILDSVESLQDELYNMTAYHVDSLVFIRRHTEFTQKLTHVNLYDPNLLNNYVDSITVKDSSTLLRKLTFHFKSNTPYAEYDILYDTTHKIISINYSVRKYPHLEIEDARLFYFLKVRMDFTNYQFSGFTDAVFSTSKFAVRQNGAFKLVSPFAEYLLVNSTNQ